MRLFAIYIGGEFPGANIEIHDVRFVVANAIEETYSELKRQWWGIPKSLHIDCWAEVSHADGYDVALRPEPFLGSEKLYFVNLGGYVVEEFAERHRNMFVVANSEAQAKSRALKMVKNWSDLHRDDLYEAEHAFCLTDRTRAEHLHVHLTPAADRQQPDFVCQYIPIRKNS